MEIQKTINYFSFKHIESNRPIDNRHVTALVSKIKEKDLLHLFPILVNTKMEIIDGQHRLEAAKRLGIYIYFKVDDKISKDDIARVNVLAKNWSLNDYINYWTVEKRPGFDVLSEFMLDYPMLPPSSAIAMLSESGSQQTRPIKDGRIDVTNIIQARNIASVINEYATFINFAYDNKFISAVIICFKTPGYDHDHMKRKLDYQSRSLVRCVNVKQYTEMLDEIYNHSMGKNRLKIAA